MRRIMHCALAMFKKEPMPLIPLLPGKDNEAEDGGD